MRALKISILLAVCAATLSVARADMPLCSWYLKTDADTLNIAYPDQSATYWSTQFYSVPIARAVIHGTYPHARYFSFHVYDAATRTVGSLADYEIDPDPGSGNPFRGAVSESGARRYTVTIEFTAKPAQPAPNTLYTGVTADGLPNLTGALIYRVYVPDDAKSADGSVGLPDVIVSTPGGDVPMGQCTPLPPSTGGSLNDTERTSNFPDEIPRVIPLGATYTDPPTTKRFFGLDRIVWDRVPPNPATDMVPRFKGTFFSNDQNAYLTTRISRQFGDTVVYKAKAPQFPDTRSGVPVATPRELRYWSLCEYDLYTERYVECSADYQTKVGDDGYFRFVISDPADKPEKINGMNWLPWGGIYYEGFIGYRQMIPDPTFATAVRNIAEGADGAAVMHEYWPQVAYCAPSKIDATGFDSCFS